MFRLLSGLLLASNSVLLLQAQNPKESEEKAPDPYAKSGNSVPEIVPLSAEREAEILQDVKVVESFEVTVFAAPPAVNYPVFVAAAPDGTLYVSSDGNGSLGRDPERGRVIRLRDLDGDGRADETKVFCEIDSPRGLVWDHDRLYLVHPPHLSVFIDRDGDGVSDEQQVLVRDIAFGFADRPADHTTNGLTLGVDGWLYIAGGDFGFVKAVGTDGRTVQHRGGGVIRVRPDGSGLEVLTTGTRNILEVAVSPLMDMFTRDNTNDGGGWNVRFHHLIPLADHGYPRLYKNFAEECIAPLADYGGGSGCGAVYIDEPGFGKWKNAPFTADWGTNALYHHALTPRGATFEETRAPEAFIRMTRPTDADVDAMSRVYAASWKGATFRWEGPEVGYIVCVRPEGFAPAPLPNYGGLADAELIEMLSLESNPSHRRRLEALRELERRGKPAYEDVYATQYANARTPERNQLDAFYGTTKTPTAGGVQALLKGANADGVTQHMAIRALGRLGAAKEIFQRLDANPGEVKGLLRALAMIHTREVVSGLIDRLESATDSRLRRGLLAALCRLHFHEGEWTGNSWGTRPDTRGPYYQPEPWSETPRIAEALKVRLAEASAGEASFLVKEMARNRIQSNEALQRMLALAKEDEKVIPEAVAHLAASDSIPQDAVSLLVKVIREDAEAIDLEVVSQAVVALAKTDSAEGFQATLTALPRLWRRMEMLEEAVAAAKALEDPAKAKHESKNARERHQASQKHLVAAVRAFVGSEKLENHHLYLEEKAAEVDTAEALWADSALIKLSGRKKGSPEARELSGKALEAGWKDPKRRLQIINAASAIRERSYGPKILAAFDDSDAEVRKAARRAAKKLGLKRTKDETPKVGSLKPEEAVAAVLEHRGDVALGEQVFTRATCHACHTVRMDEEQRGPYLGNIAQTYKRPELAQNIIEPNKTIAQGFTSELFTLDDGTQHLGFITLEGAEEVKFRNVLAEEFTVKTAAIKERQKLPQSLMPPGLLTTFTVHEFASLLDYLEALVDDGEKK